MKRRVLLALVAPILLAANVFAAVAVDSVDSSTGHQSGVGASPLTWSFTNTAGTLLVCGVSISQTNPDQQPTINSVSYNGASMTQADSYYTGTPILSFDSDGLAYFYLLSPATGSNTVSVAFTYSGSPTNRNTIAGCISFTGNDTSSPIGTAVKQKETTLGNTSSETTTVTGTTNGNYVVSMINTGSGGLAVTSPATRIWLLNASTHTGGDNAAMAYVASSGGSVGIQFTYTTDIYSSMAIEIKAPGGGGGATTSGCGSFSLLHVGCEGSH